MSNVLKFKNSNQPVLEKMSEAEQRVWAILESSMTDVKQMADWFDTSEQTIRNIKLLKTDRAKKVAVAMRAAGNEPKTWEPAARFSETQIRDIRASSASSSKLAKAYGCSASTIRMIRTGKTYVG